MMIISNQIVENKDLAPYATIGPSGYKNNVLDFYWLISIGWNSGHIQVGMCPVTTPAYWNEALYLPANEILELYLPATLCMCWQINLVWGQFLL
jgi:hypothetical protein